VRVAVLVVIEFTTLVSNDVQGFYLLLFGLSTYFLCKHKHILRRELHLIWTTALFLISTFGALVNASGGIMDTVVMYTAVRTQNYAPFISYSTHDRTQTILMYDLHISQYEQ
jgi:hypothetical protein